jgi:hypothetical protein
VLKVGQQEVQRRQALLAVDDLVVDRLGVTFGDDEVAEKVVVVPVGHRVVDVADKLLDLFGAPCEVPLVDRDRVLRVDVVEQHSYRQEARL